MYPKNERGNTQKKEASFHVDSLYQEDVAALENRVSSISLLTLEEKEQLSFLSQEKLERPLHIASFSPKNEEEEKRLQALDVLARECFSSKTCFLEGQEQNLVFGRGALSPKYMLIGEAPGAQEDASGLPFVGRSGKLLESILEEQGFHKDEYYIANILKCRPPKNRRPKPTEIKLALPWLLKQIAILQPTCLITVGSTAMESFLQKHVPMLQMRGQKQMCPYTQLPLFPIVHPAYILRSPSKRYLLEEDLGQIYKYFAQ